MTAFCFAKEPVGFGLQGQLVEFFSVGFYFDICFSFVNPRGGKHVRQKLWAFSTWFPLEAIVCGNLHLCDKLCWRFLTPLDGLHVQRCDTPSFKACPTGCSANGSHAKQDLHKFCLKAISYAVGTDKSLGVHRTKCPEAFCLLKRSIAC